MLLSEIGCNFIYVFFYFSVFGVVHSLMASIWIKEKLTILIGDKIAFYRMVYNLVSIITLIILFVLLPNNDKIVYKVSEPYSYLFLIPLIIGIIGIIHTTKYISIGEFSGISQIKKYFNNAYSANELDERMTLRIEGPYRFLRHPIYFFSIIILLSIPEITVTRFNLIVCTILYFYTGSYFEEKKLEKVFGEKYTEYKKQVPRIIPTILKRKLK
jgi:protein-S-isoprenylcysteine O-methyltransferase Ste14